MLRTLTVVFVLAVVAFAFTGCLTHVHKVGTGGTGDVVQEKTQWYAAWGIVPILDEADTVEMANGQTDYTITTQTSVIDFLISIFTNIVTITRRTVTVSY